MVTIIMPGKVPRQSIPELPQKNAYRENEFHLFGKNINIAGMAKPSQGAGVDLTLDYLEKIERKVLIGLHENEEFSESASKHGIEYHHFPIEDYFDMTTFFAKIIPSSTYDTIYNEVKQAVTDGKDVAIHCGGGGGRTGTVLASLKLRELLETEAVKAPSKLDEHPDLTTKIKDLCLGREIPCTPLVKLAIEDIRSNTVMGDGSWSVETENDIKTLIEYEKHLRLVIKSELAAQGVNTDKAILDNAPQTSAGKSSRSFKDRYNAIEEQKPQTPDIDTTPQQSKRPS